MMLHIARRLVLIADDDPEHAEIVALMLIRRGFDVQVVHSATEAVEQAVAHAPALVLLDVYMPGTDGVVAAARLRADPRTAAVPIVLVTASPNVRVLRARDVLDVIVLEKPFHSAELLWSVELALARLAVEGRA